MSYKVPNDSARRARLRALWGVLRGRPVIYGVHFRVTQLVFQKGYGNVLMADVAFHNPAGEGEATVIAVAGPNRVVIQSEGHQLEVEV